MRPRQGGQSLLQESQGHGRRPPRQLELGPQQGLLGGTEVLDLTPTLEKGEGSSVQGPGPGFHEQTEELRLPAAAPKTAAGHRDKKIQLIVPDPGALLPGRPSHPRPPGGAGRRRPESLQTLEHLLVVLLPIQGLDQESFGRKQPPGVAQSPQRSPGFGLRRGVPALVEVLSQQLEYRLLAPRSGSPLPLQPQQLPRRLRPADGPEVMSQVVGCLRSKAQGFATVVPGDFKGRKCRSVPPGQLRGQLPHRDSPDGIRRTVHQGRRQQENEKDGFSVPG